jgi:hypothetical protein
MRCLLSKEELLAVYDVPSVLCPLFRDMANWCGSDCEPLPFEDAPSPVIISSLFHQLWSSGGGLRLHRVSTMLLILSNVPTTDDVVHTECVPAAMSIEI